MRILNDSERSSLEYKFFNENDVLALLELVEIYYTEGKYPLVYCLSAEHQKHLEALNFYELMSTVELDRLPQALELYRSRKDSWLDLCKQYDIYWRHVILFVIFFGVERRPAWLIDMINTHYDSELVQLLELLDETQLEVLCRSSNFGELESRFPTLKRIRPKLARLQKDLRWDIWTDYNSLLATRPSDRNQMCCLYDRDGLKIYSYKPHQIAASMHLMTDGETTLMFDCGAEITPEGSIYIPVQSILSDLNIARVDGVFVSHAHFDHYGSLNEVRDCDCYMTENTANIIRRMSNDVVINNLKVVRELGEVNVNGVNVKFIPNGHILGSVLFDVNWSERKRLVYTGDYCVEDQQNCAGLNVELLTLESRPVDVMLTESTYGRRHGMLTHREYESAFRDVCEILLRQGKKIFIPSFAVGRAVEVALLLRDLVSEQGFKVLLDGQAAALTEYHQMSTGQAVLNSNISISRDELELIEKISSYDIIVASSGMLKQSSTSYNYLQTMLRMPNICVLKVGFIHRYEDMLISVLNRRDKNVTFIDIPLSTHAYYDALVSTLERVSPKVAIYVHGNGIDAPKKF